LTEFGTLLRDDAAESAKIRLDLDEEVGNETFLLPLKFLDGLGDFEVLFGEIADRVALQGTLAFEGNQRKVFGILLNAVLQLFVLFFQMLNFLGGPECK
jgi:hypothetical protein